MTESSPAPAWRHRPDHRRWLADQLGRQLGSGRGFAHPLGGAGWLRADGTIDPAVGVHTWVTARMLHVYALGSLAGVPGCTPLASTALAGLRGVLHDDAHGGWYAYVGPGGPDDPTTVRTKAAYPHAFVVLAASTATVAEIAGADELLAEALDVLDERFVGVDGLTVERWDEGWREVDAYRGVNSVMHTVEARLAAADATGDPAHLDRALRLTTRVVHEWARAWGWRVPEHFDETWTPLPDHHVDEPAHPFEPYGATVGHALEWSRLVVTLRAALLAGGRDAPAWMLDAAVALFDRAVADGWAVDGADGFVYTTDWDGRPVVRTRMHWVVAEAICAAAALHEATGEAAYDGWYRRWWDHAAAALVDPRTGTWQHELDPSGRPAATVWPGRPDLYHSLHAVLLPRLPLHPSPATAVRDGG